ncbi:MAG: PEP-CTERM system TPR-repeat protein PrsT [Chromatiales bacterium]|nr:PEP-CTERM system TPR-repeat protein PrsT [Chromatiales bacterium]
MLRGWVKNSSLACLIVVSAACSGPELTDAEYLARAKSALAANELRSAQIELKNALRVNRQNIEARWLLGKLYVENGQPEEGKKELDFTLRHGIERGAALIYLARAELQLGNYQALLDRYEVSDGFKPNDAAYLLATRGHAFQALGNSEKALASYDKALQIVPGLSDALVGKATVAATRGEEKDARRLIDQTLKDDPKFAPAWSVLGRIERDRGNFIQAVVAYGKAVEFGRLSWGDRLERAKLYVDLGNDSAAQKDLDALKESLRMGTEAILLQGRIYLNDHRWEAAVESLNTAASLGAQDDRLNFYLGIAYLMVGKDWQAAEYLTKFRSQRPRSVAANVALAQVQFRLGEYKSSLDLLTPVLAQDPTNPYAQNLVGRVYLETNQVEKAVTAFREALLAKPESHETRGLLSQALIRAGEAEDARKMLEKSVADSPKDLQNRLLLVSFLLRQGDYDGAMKASAALEKAFPASSLGGNFKAVTFLGEKKFDQAKSVLEEVLRNHPGDKSALGNLAAIAMLEKDFERARDYLQTAVDADPTDVDSLLAFSRVEQEAGDSAKSESYLRKALEIDPQSLEVRLKLVELLVERGRSGEAANLLTGTIDEQQLDSPLLLRVRTESLLLSGRAEEARNVVQRWMEVEPTSARAYYLGSQAASDTGDVDTALKWLAKAAEIDPDSYLINSAYVRFLLMLGKDAEGQRRLARLVDAYPDNVDVLELNGWANLKLGNLGEAERLLSKLLGEKASGPTARRLALVKVKRGDAKGGIAVLRSWLEENPKDWAARYQLAKFLEEQGDLAKARNELATVIADDPDNIGALNDLAWLARKTDPENARKYAERAYILAPRRAEVSDTLAMLVKDTEPARAIRLLQEAIRLNPEIPEMRLHLAEILYGADQSEDALQVLAELDAMESGAGYKKQANELRRRIRYKR